MKKLLLILILIFINILLTGQEIVITDSLFLQSKTIFDYDENISKNILYCEKCNNAASTELPVYYKRILLDKNYDVVSAVFTAVNTEVINNKDINSINNLDKITSDLKINAWVSVFRKQYYLNIEFIPLRKNAITGELEKIKSFEIKARLSENQINTKINKSFISQSKLSSGNWYKIKVAESGLYKLTYSQIVSLGFSNVNNFGVFGYGGMVSKTAGENLYDDLPELPLHMVDVNSNNVFDSGDYVLFWLDGPHSKNFSIDGNFSHEFHNYSDYAFYFVSDKGTFKSPDQQSQLSSYDFSVNTYNDYLFLEKDSINLIKSGRNWFWREFDYYLTQNFSLNIPNISFTDTAKVTVLVAAKSSINSSFNLLINGQPQSHINISSVTGSSTDVYAMYNSLKDFYVIPNSENFTFQLTYNKSAANSKAWLDYISVTARRKLVMNNGIVNFRDIKSVGDGNKTKFSISGASSATIVWDITDRTNVHKIIGNYNNGIYSINVETTNLREFIAFDPTYNFPSPILESDGTGPVENQNLHALQPADVIIVANPLLLSQANALKQLHTNYYGYSVVVATTDKIYNEFSSGTPDVSAIRNFVKMLYDRSSDPNKMPHSLVLFGDGSYNNRSNSSTVSNLILTYQSESSLSPISSFVSDDFYVHLDDGEGSLSGIHDMDMGVGRIPVKNSTEADAFIKKLMIYHSSDSYGSWKNNLLLVADDAEEGQTLHQIQSDQLSMQIGLDMPVFNITKLFLDDYEQISTVQGHRYPDVNQEINNQMNNGNLIVNWIGHGNDKGWAHESILTLSMIKSWKNAPKFPIFVTATCEFSPFDNSEIVSGGEEVLLNADGGGIALFTTTRVAFALSNFQLSSKFYNRLFETDENGKVYPIGLAAAKAKNDQGSDSNKRVFNFLGDAAMQPAIPYLDVVSTKINGVEIENFTDTIKATQLVTIEGEIHNPDGSLKEDFNGLVFPIVYDKIMNYSTRGNDGYEPLNYSARKNILFKGKASVTNGKFSFSFIVPVDIAYFFDFGKVSYYAHNYMDLEAHGYDESFIIGGTDDSELNDNNGPEIELFLNNEDFIHGGITDENPALIVNLKDESGINTVGNGIGHDITLIIDDNTSNQIVLNNFYESTLDDFTSGKVNYPMQNLTQGPHTIKLKAWDVLNNSSEEALDFIVANSSELVIEYVLNYPNPFSTKTAFYFAHNQPYVSLDVSIQIFTISGKHIKTINTTLVSDGFNSEPIEWDGTDEYGDKLAKGVYVYKVKVKSPNGNVVEKYEKLVILN